MLCGNDLIYLLNGGTSFSLSFIKFSEAARFFSHGLKRRFHLALTRGCACEKDFSLVTTFKRLNLLFV